jgi:hypothetical protein
MVVPAPLDVRAHARVWSVVMSDTWATAWPRFVQRQVKQSGKDAVAKDAGVHVGTVNKWLAGTGGHPDVKNVISLGRTRNKIGDALVAAGYLNKEDLSSDGRLIGSEERMLSDDELIQQLSERLASRRELADETESLGAGSRLWSDDAGVNGVKHGYRRG